MMNVGCHAFAAIREPGPAFRGAWGRESMIRSWTASCFRGPARPGQEKRSGRAAKAWHPAFAAAGSFGCGGRDDATRCTSPFRGRGATPSVPSGGGVWAAEVGEEISADERRWVQSSLERDGQIRRQPRFWFRWSRNLRCSLLPALLRQFRSASFRPPDDQAWRRDNRQPNACCPQEHGEQVLLKRQPPQIDDVVVVKNGQDLAVRRELQRGFMKRHQVGARGYVPYPDNLAALRRGKRIVSRRQQPAQIGLAARLLQEADRRQLAVGRNRHRRAGAAMEVEWRPVVIHGKTAGFLQGCEVDDSGARAGRARPLLPRNIVVIERHGHVLAIRGRRRRGQSRP